MKHIHVVVITLFVGTIIGAFLSTSTPSARAAVDDNMYRLIKATEKIASEVELIRRRCERD